MKFIKKIFITTLLAVFLISIADLPAISSPVTAQAATVKLSKKTLSLGVGKTATLTVRGNKKSVIWTSSDSTIATVSKKGKITAVALGEAKITATIGMKQYTCKVTVTNPYLADAPFKAQEADIENKIDLVIPADWTLNYKLTDTGIQGTITPNDTTLKSGISVLIRPLDQALTYSDMKATYSSYYTKDNFTKQYTTLLGDTAFELSDLVQTDLTTNPATALKVEYTITIANTALVQQIYDFVLGNYLVEIQSVNNDGTDLSAYIEYAINSLIVK